MMPSPRLLPLLLAGLAGLAQAGAIIDTRLPPVQAKTSADDPAMPANPEARKAWNAARLALGSNDLKAAEAAFKEAARLDPKSASPLVGLAELALRRKDLAGVQTHVQEALKREPKSPTARLAQARLALVKGQAAEGEALLKSLIKDEPSWNQALLDLADLTLRTQRPAEALPLYTQVLAQVPTSFVAALGQARAQFAMGKKAEAVAALDAASQRSPNPTPLLVAAAEFALAQGDKAAGLKYAQRAQQGDPKSQPAAMMLADAQVANGDFAKGMETLQSMLVLPDVSVAMVHTKMAGLKEARKDLDGAMASYRQALRADSRFHPALNNLAWLTAERKQDLDEGLRAGRRALELVPNNLSYMDTLAHVLLVRKEPKAVLELLKKLPKDGPRIPMLLLREAQAYAALDDTARAKSALAEVLKLNPQMPEAQPLRKELGL